MRTKIESINIELTLDEVQILWNELYPIINNIEIDGKTDLTVTTIKKLHDQLGKTITAHKIGESITNVVLKAKT